MQVALVLALIAVSGQPLWLDLLIYLTVASTVLSGADYFFGLRRGLRVDQGTASSQARRVV